jgi:hypothetical protein
MALVTVLIGSVVVLAVAAAGASCLIGAARASSAAQRSLVGAALLEGELARVRAGDLPLALLSRDLESRAERLLPDPETSAAVRPAGEPGLHRVDLEVRWREPGRAVHRTSLSGLVHSDE